MGRQTSLKPTSQQGLSNLPPHESPCISRHFWSSLFITYTLLQINWTSKRRVTSIRTGDGNWKFDSKLVGGLVWLFSGWVENWFHTFSMLGVGPPLSGCLSGEGVNTEWMPADSEAGGWSGDGRGEMSAFCYNLLYIQLSFIPGYGNFFYRTST